MRDLSQHPVSGRPDRSHRPGPAPHPGPHLCRSPGQGPSTAPAPLAVTSDPALADALLRGAGCPPLAAALPRAGPRRGLRSTLVDLDPAGGGIDLLFGLETEPGPRWSELAQWRDGRLCGRSLRDALPTYAAHSRHGLAAGLGFAEEGADRLPVLAWPRARPGEDDGPGWLGARPGAAEDPWYDSGTPLDPGKTDPWLTRDGASTGSHFGEA